MSAEPSSPVAMTSQLDQGMDTEQQDGREFAYMILHCVEMHGKGDDEPDFH